MYFNQFNYFLFILIIVFFSIYIYFQCNIRYVILSDAYNKDVIIIIIIIIKLLPYLSLDGREKPSRKQETKMSSVLSSTRIQQS